MFNRQRISGSIYTVPVGSVLLEKITKKTLWQKCKDFSDFIVFEFKRRDSEEEKQFTEDMKKWDKEMKERNEQKRSSKYCKTNKDT